MALNYCPSQLPAPYLAGPNCDKPSYSRSPTTPALSEPLLKFAAIDIGSNAVRLKVYQVLDHSPYYGTKLIEYLRFPLRLGADVFDGGYIRPETRVKLGKLLLAFKQLCELYEVAGYRTCATSALRDSENAIEVRAWVQGFAGLEIEVITGEQEAELVGLALAPFLKHDHYYLHIDVGGGSTELNVYEGKTRLAGTSFQAGHVRNRVAAVSVWPEMDAWLDSQLGNLPHHAKLEAIATGGNIAKLIQLYGKLYKPKERLKYDQLLTVYMDIAELDLEERVYNLNLNADRADVIIPSAEIYLHAMRQSGAVSIYAPEVGLADGIIIGLMDQHGLDVTKLRPRD